MIVLVDTNVLLDVIHKRDPHYDNAARIWELVEQGRIEGHVSAISFNNVFYVARKQLGSDRARDAVQVVRDTFRFVPLDEFVIDRALATTTPDFEDAIQAAAAIQARSNYIVTRNVVDFRGLGVTGITPGELLLAVSRACLD